MCYSLIFNVFLSIERHDFFGAHGAQGGATGWFAKVKHDAGNLYKKAVNTFRTAVLKKPPKFQIVPYGAATLGMSGNQGLPAHPPYANGQTSPPQIPPNGANYGYNQQSPQGSPPSNSHSTQVEKMKKIPHNSNHHCE